MASSFLRRLGALLKIKLLSDAPATRDIPPIGAFTFRRRRHRWLLGADPFGGHHAQTLALFRALIRPGDVVYDIGANIGYYTRHIAQIMNARTVVAFEPMSENADLLEANVALGRLGDRVRVFRAALSDHDGQESLQIDDVMGGTAVLDSVSQGNASESRAHLGLPPKSERVTVVRLDRLVQEQQLPMPRFIKIDTEGAEALVLKGGLETLRRARPRLAIAVHGPGPTRATLDLLIGLDYAVFGEVKRGSVQRLRLEDADRLANNNITAAGAEDEEIIRSILTTEAGPTSRA
jgi:FkbM family methyltransferase